jgi:UPF0755 protein
MKKVVVFILILIVLAGIIGGWIFFGPGTAFKGERAFLYIRSDAATKGAVLDSITTNELVSNQTAFNFLANRLNYWKNIRPGKYEIKQGASVFSIVRMLRNGKQTPVKFVINKVRTKEGLAAMAGNKFEFDSTTMLNFLNNQDSLRAFHVDPEVALSVLIPDSYSFYWNTTPRKVYQKFYEASLKFWTPERKEKAAQHGLSPLQAYILASIVEEETNAAKEKGTIASTYLNRLEKGMPLQADPTIKFAMKDFALTRIYGKYLTVSSPYNTYQNKGLPPGPICTPSRQTIDAVLNAPKTNYLYFVASSKEIGTHDFSETFEEHMQKAKLYHQYLDERDSIKKANGE